MPYVNAVSLPGGHIVIFSGLLDVTTSENELAFVLGHEIGHYAQRDHLKGLGRGLIFVFISTLLFGNDNSLADFITQWVKITDLNFSQKAEERADQFGADILNCFYGHAAGGSSFLRKMLSVEDQEKIPHFYSTHPETRLRIKKLDKYAEKKGYVSGELTEDHEDSDEK
ncbi:M48 family metallopeptidase [Fibrobacterota bacterium]